MLTSFTRTTLVLHFGLSVMLYLCSWLTAEVILKLSVPTCTFSGQVETYEPPHGKTNNLHMRKQRRRSASR